MANTNILLGGLAPTDPAGAISSGFSQGEQIAQAPMRNRLLEAQTGKQETQLTRDQAVQQLESAYLDASKIKPILSSDPQRAASLLQERISTLDSEGRNSDDSRALLGRIQSGDIEGATQELDSVINLGNQFGIGVRSKNAATQAFDYSAKAAGLKPGTPEYIKAAQIELGLSPRAGTVTGQERVATTPGLSSVVAGSEAEIAGAKAESTESSKLDVQAKKLPDIKAAVAEAETQAKAKGEAFTSYNQAKAALPGLEDVVGKLKELAPVATSTFAGKVFDVAVKELGFGSTGGADARAKFIAIVDNQVLPLLKQTFGSAFTVSEGEALKSTMGDPDASPSQKVEQLNAFIEGKYRDLEEKERGLGVKSGSFTSSSGIQFTVE